MSYQIEPTTVRPLPSIRRITLSRVVVPYLAVLYIICLVVAFRFFVTKYWAYSGLIWNPPAAASDWVIMLGAALIPVLAIPVTYGRPSRLVLWLFYIVVYVPTCLVGPLQNGGVGPYWQFIFALMVSFLIVVQVSELPLLRISPLRIPFPWFITGLIALSALTFGMSFWFYGIPTSIPALSEVYDVRTVQRSRAEAAPVILAYLAGWQYRVVNLLVMALGIQLHKRWLLLAGLGGQLYFYAVTGHKSVLFSSVLVLGIWILTRRFRGGIGPLALVGTIGMIVMTSLILIAGNLMLFSIFVRRLLIVPGNLSARYYEYFTEFGFTRTMDPITRLLFESPFDMSPAYLVGLHYSGTAFSANANFWASAFAGFGIGGMIWVSLIFGSMLWIMNTMASGEYRLVGNILVALSTFSLTNGDLSTTIGTHGLGIAFLFLIVQPIIREPDQIDTDEIYASHLETGVQPE